MPLDAQLPRIKVATDVGGTFTDLVFAQWDPALQDYRPIQSAKARTTPPDYEAGVFDVLRKGGVSPADVGLLAHGSTIVINALTERHGAKTGLITTRGFRDVLEIARGNRPDLYNFTYRKPAPFVPRHLRCEIGERIDYKGQVLQPLALGELPAIVECFRAEGVASIAICLLYSFLNPAHEIAVRDEIARLWPDVAVVASHEIIREWREYERTSTTVFSAFVSPKVRHYANRLEAGLRRGGFTGNLYFMQSNGGVDTSAAACARPIAMIESGPASGMLGAAAVGRLIGETNLIALDIGGTTAKCSLIDDGQVQITTDYRIEKTRTSPGYPVMTPVVDLVEIGNGGGSIGWLDPQGRLRVGPQSAGAVPGPVVYGAGGTEPTTTDANILLGRLDHRKLLGGEIAADLDAVQRSFERLGTRLGLDAVDVARGMIRIANENMVNALKLVSLNRGHDPRDFALFAFGGGGPLHAAELAPELEMMKIIVPAESAVFSALGMILSDLRRDYVQTAPLPLDAAHAGPIAAVLDGIEARAIAEFAQDGVGRGALTVDRLANMRYAGQEFTIQVPLPAGQLTAASVAAIQDTFRDKYAREYGYQLPNTIEIVVFHIVASATIHKPTLRKLTRGSLDAQQARIGARDIDFGAHGRHTAAIYDRAQLGAGAALAGPAAVEELTTTTLVFPQQTLTVDDYGNLHIRAAR